MICDGRITGDGLRSLLSATECRMWLFSDDSWTLEAAGACNVATKTMAFPSLEWCLDATGTPDYPYSRTFDEAKWEDILVIHTSGTTGMCVTLSTTSCKNKHFVRSFVLKFLLGSDAARAVGKRPTDDTLTTNQP